MFARASRGKLSQHVSRPLHISPNDLYLPWLCPALYAETYRHRASSSLTSPQTSNHTRAELSKSKDPNPTLRSKSRGLASATAFDYISPADDYVPFESQPRERPPAPFQLPWIPAPNAATAHDSAAAEPPLVIKDSLTTKPPRFRSFDAITGELGDIKTTMKACLHVGRFDRAAVLLRRLNMLYKPDAPALLDVHNDYIREYAWKIATTRDQRLLNNLQRWFEVEMRGRGMAPDAQTYAFMIQAVMQDVSISRSTRSVRRYLHLAEDQGLRDELMNVLLTVLNEQDFGRVTRIDMPPMGTSTLEPPPSEEIASPSTIIHDPDTKLPEVRAVDSKLPGWKALRQSLSVFSDSSMAPMLDSFEGTAEEKSKRLAIERQLRMEQDTYEAAIERWRSDNEHLKSVGINSALKQNAFGAMMWKWHEAMEPAIQEEIRLANEAEHKAIKKEGDEDRCQYGPFLQYLEPKKLSAITILTSTMLLGTAAGGDRGTAVTRLVTSIGEAVQNESVAQLLRTTRKYKGVQQASGGVSAVDVRKELRKRRRQATAQSSNPSTRAFDQHEWSKVVKARVGAVLLSKLFEAAKLQVRRKHPDNGSVFEETQPAFLHQYVYVAGRRIGVVSLNSSLHDQLAREPIAASLAQKYLPMVVEPKPWVGFREGGFLTSTDPLVRLPQSDQQSKSYSTIAVDNGDMAQVSAGLDVLARTPWQINGSVYEVMLEVWNSGEAIGTFAPENPQYKLPAESDGGDKAAYAAYLSEVRSIGNEKAAYKSLRCYQNFQMEIARAYLNETFYFPHNVDFRGRAYPMSPFLNYMGADLCRGMLTFGVGKALGPTGLKWLKIHLANVYGYDKASFEERISFAETHLADIHDSASKPLAGARWWLQAEDPWQCLAACKELQNALNSPDPHEYVSKLAIHQDGTCNGLQHYAALGGDQMGAQQVNLEPGDRPSDIYTGVSELVKEDIAEEARQGHKLAQMLEGKITRKVVKQTVMTNVYGVTFVGAKLQVSRQLKDLYPDFPSTAEINHSAAASYIAKKIFKALANLFNGAHDIQYWLGDCASRIATALTPEQINHIEAAVKGTLDEPNDYKRKPLTRKTDRGYKNDLLAFKQSVIWTTPLKMPVVQPYRQKTKMNVITNLQKITLNNPSLADPVNKRKQLQAFPPNFIHSLDATHMLLSALQCEQQGLTFTAVHDSFWTHASDVETMNGLLRDTFIRMHSEDIIGRLAAEFAIRYKDCMYLTAVKLHSRVGRRIKEWRGKSASSGRCRGKALEARKLNELLEERKRLALLASQNEEEMKRGKGMVTAYSLFEDMDGEEDLAAPEDLKDVKLGSLSMSASSSAARANKVLADRRLEVGDEDNIDPAFVQEDVSGLAESGVEEDTLVTNEPEIPAAGGKRRGRDGAVKGKSPVRKIWLWRPLTFPPVPKKGEFDVSRIRESRYFFS
ncbi:MAG: hypothetical protein Q9222_003971 [Ikaeria aurantiellina]